MLLKQLTKWYASEYPTAAATSFIGSSGDISKISFAFPCEAELNN